MITAGELTTSYTVTELVALHRVLATAGMQEARGYTRDRIIAALNKRHPVTVIQEDMPAAVARARAVLFGREVRP